jgi:hypothetical protein
MMAILHGWVCQSQRKRLDAHNIQFTIQKPTNEVCVTFVADLKRFGWSLKDCGGWTTAQRVILIHKGEDFYVRALSLESVYPCDDGECDLSVNKDVFAAEL